MRSPYPSRGLLIPLPPYTPTRALDRAYLAALNIKSLEADYAAAKNQLSNERDGVILTYLQPDIDKFLTIIKVNLAEFKVSRFVLNNHNPDYWSKIILIEEILSKYHPDIIEPVVISDASQSQKISQDNNSNSWSPDSSNPVKPITEKQESYRDRLAEHYLKLKLN